MVEIKVYYYLLFYGDTFGFPFLIRFKGFIVRLRIRLVGGFVGMVSGVCVVDHFESMFFDHFSFRSSLMVSLLFVFFSVELLDGGIS